MKDILLKASVAYYPHYATNTTKRYVFYRWHCRVCGRSGRVTRVYWHYIKGLGLEHYKYSHTDRWEKNAGRTTS